MMGQKKEEWMKLCERAANEQDPAMLMELVAEIDRLLEERQNRLKARLTGHKVDPEPSTKNHADPGS